MQLNERIVLITGAGSGIGRQLAIEAARREMTVVLTGRRPEALNATLSMMEPGASHVALIMTGIWSHTVDQPSFENRAADFRVRRIRLKQAP